MFSSTGGSSYAQLNRDKLLAEAFPALSLPVGGNTGGEMKNKFGLLNVFDMQATFKNGWPQERGNDKDWFHSDMREVSYLYVYKLFKEFVTQMEENQ